MFCLIIRSSPRPVSIEEALCDHRTYERQIERLHKKYLLSHQLYDLQQDGVPLASIILNATKVAKLIARQVENGDYQFQPARLQKIQVGDKVRVVFAYGLIDRIVHSAIAEIIEDRTSHILSSKLYSYRKGVSWWTAISDFASYIRDYQRHTPDPKQRGLYVLRRDIDSYTDSIPVDPGSRIWKLLRDVLASSPANPSSSSSSSSGHDDKKKNMPSNYCWNLIEQSIRPEVRAEDGKLFCRLRGVPTGQRISCVLFNLYLVEMDRELGNVPSSFYARYSDDILFAHPNVEVVKDVSREIERIVVCDHNLALKASKSQNLYLTSPGRKTLEWGSNERKEQECRGTPFIPFLGARVWADGTVSLERKKTRPLLRDIERRAYRAASAVRRKEEVSCCGRGAESEEDGDNIGRVVCSTINKALDPDGLVYSQKSISLLVKAVTDRRQLAQLDYWIARIVIRVVTGDPSVKAFRRVPYSKVRQEWGLASILYARNKWGR